MSPVTLNRLASKAQLIFRRVLANHLVNAQSIIMHYDATAPTDRNDRATYPAASPGARTLNALVHFVSDMTRGFGPAEYEVGDVLLFIDPNQDTSGENAWFEIQGASYAQKDGAGPLAADWSLEIGGRLIHRAMVLTRVRGVISTTPVPEDLPTDMIRRFGSYAIPEGVGTFDLVFDRPFPDVPAGVDVFVNPPDGQPAIRINSREVFADKITVVLNVETQAVGYVANYSAFLS